MRRTEASAQKGSTPRRTRSKSRRALKPEQRYRVGLPAPLVPGLERYAAEADLSMSKAISSLARLGLESQESRKRDFFKRLKQNLANDNPSQQDRVADEFRALIPWRRVHAEDPMGSITTERKISQDELFDLAEWKAQDPGCPRERLAIRISVRSNFAAMAGIRAGFSLSGQVARGGSVKSQSRALARSSFQCAYRFPSSSAHRSYNSATRASAACSFA